MTGRPRPGLSAQIKEALIQRGLQARARSAGQAPVPTAAESEPVPDAFCRFDLHPAYRQMRIIAEGAEQLGIRSPFFRPHEGIAGARTRIEGREYLNFSSYNYLGLNGHPAVSAAASAAIERHGTSVSASRAVSGERPVHRELEAALARAYGTDEAVAFVSGHATNVTVIGYLFGARDLVLHDELIHNSTLQGIRLAGSHRLSFPHNDWAALDELLVRHRRQYERVLIVVEGLYSMDGDYPQLPRFIDIKRRHKAFLMVDEAHSFGVMGPRGLGICEHFGLSGTDVDIWMGTLSKALAGCGGYIAGSTALVEHLKFLAPGFLYSVGMAPPLAAASLAALEHLRGHPELPQRLRERGALFLQLTRAAGIDTGPSAGISVIPVVVGSSIRAARLSEALFERGINVQPILYPAVPEKQARLRFFMCCEHTEQDVRVAVEAVARELR
ncbi:MAG TPA: aminotransferase class I/II-fold pyridoxal phosphate-dependent enzyme [Steroidobacteraceae bacterium]|nr:aminotransferase class I/II-fold pyridoxal phosphate-dependent enzyme [Steroidobacteraceae bacterium]